MTGQLYGKDISFEADITLTGGITASGNVQFRSDIQAQIVYRPVSPAITEPFWSMNPGSSQSESTTGGSTAPTTQSLDVRISSSKDDAEERNVNGYVYLESTDLELVDDPTHNGFQVAGMRFTGISIPQGATITNAYIQFTADNTDSGTTNLVIRGEASNNAAAFSSSAYYNISSRPMTMASINWAPPAWNKVGEADANQRTSDLAPIIQEIVNQGGWGSGNAMAFVVTGSGERTAEAYDGSSSKAPLLHIEWQ